MYSLVIIETETRRHVTVVEDTKLELILRDFPKWRAITVSHLEPKHIPIRRLVYAGFDYDRLKTRQYGE